MTFTAETRRRRAKRAWYRDGLEFECTQCGACCTGAPGYVWVGRAEIDAIARRLGLGATEFATDYLRLSRGRYSLRERKNGDCVLLDPERRTCRAYDLRPVQCRTWPWWPENLNSPETWERCADDCPGVNRGRRHSASHIQQQLERDRAAEGPE